MKIERQDRRECVRDVKASQVADVFSEEEFEKREETIADDCVDPSGDQKPHSFVFEEPQDNFPQSGTALDDTVDCAPIGTLD